MKTRFIVNLANGAISRSIEGVAVADAQVGILYARDLLDCELQFKAGTSDVTSDVLAGDKVATIGLRQFPSFGAILAQSTNFVYEEAGVPTCTLNLDTSEIIALVDSLPTQARFTKVYFEIEISNIAGTFRQTVAQQQFTLFCEVNMNGDLPPSLPPSTFTIHAGESIPAVMTVTRDGNGNLIDSIDDYVVRVVIVNDETGSETLSKTSDDGSVTVSGNSASWLWASSETAAFPRKLRFYVFLDDAIGVSAAVLSGTITTQPL